MRRLLLVVLIVVQFSCAKRNSFEHEVFELDSIIVDNSVIEIVGYRRNIKSFRTSILEDSTGIYNKIINHSCYHIVECHIIDSFYYELGCDEMIRIYRNEHWPWSVIDEENHWSSHMSLRFLYWTLKNGYNVSSDCETGSYIIE